MISFPNDTFLHLIHELLNVNFTIHCIGATNNFLNDEPWSSMEVVQKVRNQLMRNKKFFLLKRSAEHRILLKMIYTVNAIIFPLDLIQYILKLNYN